MKKTLIAFIMALFTITAFAQDTQRNTVSVVGNAQLTLYPVSFKLRLFIQEEMLTMQYGKPGTKTKLDSIRAVLFDNLKAYGYNESDLKLIKRSSTAYGGSPAMTLDNEVYEIKNVKAVMAEKLVTDLRFIGLKGVIARPQYPIISRAMQDSVYAAAIKDGHNMAINMAKEVEKTVGDTYNIGTYNSNIFRDISADYDNNDAYNLARFEMSLTDSRVIPVMVNLTYELKKN